MRSTGSVSWRVLGASAAVALAAACADQPPGLDLGEPGAPTAGPRTFVTHVRSMEPGDLGFANPAGLAFSPAADMLLVVSRPPGTPAGPTADVALVTLAEDRAGGVRIATGVADPVNLTFDPRANRLLVYEAASRQLIEIAAGADGSLDPQRLRRVDAASFGVSDARGVTVDPESGLLFILDGAGPRIVRVEPDARQGFAAPFVSVIDLAATGWAEARGLAFDETTGHLHVLDVAGQALHELTATGRLVATRDLSEFGLRNPQGMTFGFSGDPTDDPAEMSLYIAERGLSAEDEGRITELSFVEPPVPAMAAATVTVTGTLVQTIQTSRFSPPSPDPSGITYATHLGRLVIVDGEVDEMSIYRGANVFEASTAGSLVRAWTTTSFSREPVGAAYNPGNRHLFISDDNGKKVYEVDPGSDGLYSTSDDRVTFISLNADDEGVAYDAAQGVLFVADGVGNEVWRIAPGPNGLFDGTDDVVTHFDTQSLGCTDPEGIAWDSDFGHLYIVGKPATAVFHVTTTGTLIRTVNISAAGAKKPAGLEYAPGSQNPNVKSLWIVDRNVDNNSDPNENDGKLYEFSIPPLSGNSAPTVTITAPANGATFTEGTAVTFTGSASDVQDGNLTPSLAWTSSLDGAIGSGGSFSTSTLSVGSHTITASVTDSDGTPGSASISVTVNPEGAATLEVRVAASSDDAEESATGTVGLTSSDLELVQDASAQTVGIRFNAVTIPPGATVTNAYVQFQADEAFSDPTSLTIRGQATGNAATFTTATGNVSSRTRTTSVVSWSPPPWATVGEAGVGQRTPNLAGIIQEIVTLPGWSSGNSLAIIITGTGRRTAESQNGMASAAPLLHVDYSTGPNTNTAPIASNVTITGTPQVGHVLTGNYTYSDAQGDEQGSSTYRWLRNGGTIPNAAAGTYTLVPADLNAMIVFEVTPFAATGASPGAPAQSGAVGPVLAAGGNSVPTATAVTITGTAQVGHVLTGNYTYSDADNDLEGTSAYRWLRNGGTITNATARTYTLVPADQDAMIIFEVTPFAASGASPGAPAQSGAVGPVAPASSVSTVEVRVATGSDDAEESAAGSMYLTSSDLELVFDSFNGNGNQTVGMRFNGLAVPSGATITNAYIQFQADGSLATATSLTIQGQAADNPVTFSTAAGNLSLRTRTTNAVSWSPAAWTSGQAGVDQRTPSIAAIIQAIVSRPGWSSGNSLVIIVTGTGQRRAQSYEGLPSAAALLHVEYSTGSSISAAAGR